TRDYVYAGTRLVSVIKRAWTESPSDPYDYGAIVANGPTVNAILGTSGRDLRLLFEAIAGERVSVYGSVAGGSLGCAWHLKILNPDGTVLTGADPATCGPSAFIEPVTLPIAGTYSVVIDPAGSGTGTIDVNLYDVVDFTAVITAGGPAVSAPVTVP